MNPREQIQKRQAELQWKIWIDCESYAGRSFDYQLAFEWAWYTGNKETFDSLVWDMCN